MPCHPALFMKVLAVIPAYNEAKTIADVLRRTRVFVQEMVVVDDGSSDGTAEVARGEGARVIHHKINRGLGAALATGFETARRLGGDIIVTLDADGQHDPQEIPKFVEAIQGGAQMVIGSRMLLGQMPWYRRVANTLGNIATVILFGAWVSDTQSGFRAFSSEALARLDLRTNHMEISSELVGEARRNCLRIVEIPIQAIYTDYSLSKGQNFFVGIKTFVKLLLRRLTH